MNAAILISNVFFTFVYTSLALLWTFVCVGSIILDSSGRQIGKEAGSQAVAGQLGDKFIHTGA